MIKQIRRYDGRFAGFRVNCEQVPQLPACAVREVWDDPRQVPYLLLWRSRWDGEVKEAVRVRRSSGGAIPGYDLVEIKRRHGGAVRVRLLWQALPRGSGRGLLLECSFCGKPCRALYRKAWECRKCSGLRYVSEGGALLIRYAPLLRNLGCPGPVACKRLEPWHPLIFSNPDHAAVLGFRING
jgi:hypothetical protein